MLNFLIPFLSLGIIVNALRGISPESLDLYKPDSSGNWACLSNPGIVIPFDKVNDNWCDCPDGSDEPGTPACANGLFYCENKGHIPGYVPSFKVADGICDYDACCDGSDENEFGFVKCPNKCKQIHEQYDKQLKQQQKEWIEGHNAKEKLTIEAKQIRNDVINKIDAWETELVGAQNELAQVKQKLSEIEQADENSETELPQGLVHAKENLGQLEGLEEIMTGMVDRLDVKMKALGALLDTMKVEHNPNFHDPAVSAAIRGWDDIQAQSEKGSSPEELKWTISQIDALIKTVSEDLNDLDLTSSTIPENSWIPPIFFNQFERFLDFLADNSIIVRSNTSQRSNKRQSETVRLATEKVDEAKRRVDDLERNIENSENDLQADYGDDDVFRALRGTCIKDKVGEYDYEVCLFGSIHQYGHGQTTKIGEYSSLNAGESYMKYGNGAKCWNGPVRSAQVDFVCGGNLKVLSVSEPEKCSYSIKMACPAVCGDDKPTTNAKFVIRHDEL